jgi:hypothetical protein
VVQTFLLLASRVLPLSVMGDNRRAFGIGINRIHCSVDIFVAE